ncbi:hypothetical protein BATR1942_02835 [Bacillus atrophaeus 1942]|uniref:Uncharacterized protein n=1 Tax=Bacillus atrophaeus (strain 1942) TaxID=720555 RepID=A0ABM5LUW9_BACA1|nr:hypothetical protein BATR1942_02835 [Bacillus atrophaeus 1942]EIM10204.1 hypothetical protein UY9_13786 [Bacillus atrophaeus C89]
MLFHKIIYFHTKRKKMLALSKNYDKRPIALFLNLHL